MPITKQTIAIIGVQSDIASDIAKGVCTENYRLLLFDENESKIKKVAEEIYAIDNRADVETMVCTHLASWESDIIILSVDEKELSAIIRKIKDVATQKIVLGISDGSRITRINGSDDIYTTMPHSKIAEIIDVSSAGSSDHKNRVSVMIRGNDSNALNTAIELVNAAGMIVKSSPLVERKRHPDRFGEGDRY